MSTPPRRRRNPDASDSGAGGRGWLPTIAIGLGVVIAGLGIGALVAVLMQRNTPKVTPVAMVTSTPATPARPIPPTRLPAPITIATLMPPHTSQSQSPSPPPSATPSPATTPSLEPSVEPTSRPTLVPTAKPSLVTAARPPREPVLKPSLEPAPREPNTSSAAVVAAATSTPRAAPSEPAQTPAPEPSRSPAESAATLAAPVQTQSGYDERASAVVRRYLAALIRGDEKTASAALGGNAGALSEQAFLDPSARIVSLKVIRLDASNASVGCEIASAKGHYYATYRVKAASGGPYIAEHDYIKV
jgi:hypothetical protein